MDAKKPYMLKFCQMRLFFLQSGGNCGGKAFERWQRDICRFLRFCRRSSLDRTCRRRCAVVVAALLVVRQLGPLRCHLSKNSKKKSKKKLRCHRRVQVPFLAQFARLELFLKVGREELESVQWLLESVWLLHHLFI